MLFISEAIDYSNQIEMEEQEAEEFVDCYLKESAPHMQQEGQAALGQYDPNNYNLRDIGIVDLSLFLIYILKSRISILET